MVGSRLVYGPAVRPVLDRVFWDSWILTASCMIALAVLAALGLPSG
jgi:hypothetical protein